MALLTKRDYDATILLASGLRELSDSGDSVRLPGMVQAFVFRLDVTVDESAVGDKLDVYVQTMEDGTNWVDVVHFVQHAGNAGAHRYYHKLEVPTACVEFENGTALAAAAGRDLFGDEWRVRWAIIDGSKSAAFTFSVTVCPF